MVALSGTLLVVYQFAQQSMTFLFSPEVTCIFSKRVTHVFLDNAFLQGTS
jgi:hypothetical protein